MPCVYSMTNRPHGTLYTGFANDLATRIEQHTMKVVDGFTKCYGLDLLVWYEFHESVIEARQRERRIKKWHRDWKVNLIQAMNPEWRDLSQSL